ELHDAPGTRRPQRSAIERPLTPTSRPLTLGERKSLARGHRRDVLEKLFVDPHVMVVELLLDNPHIREEAVLVIGSKRPQASEHLMAISGNERWACRQRVKRALALNPATPVLTTIRFLPTLTRGDVRDVAAYTLLHPTVRDYAATLLRRWS